MMLSISHLYVAVCLLLFTSFTSAIDQQLYDLFVRYTKYAAASYARGICPTPPNGADQAIFLSNYVTDTQVWVFRNDGDQEIIIAFRGTSSLIDFGTDINQGLVPFTAAGVSCAECQVNNGTLIAWNSITDQVVTTLNAQKAANPNYRIIVTGHSLGGALASIASASLVGLGNNITTYTLGQFRTGDPAYASYIDSILPQGKMYRITHTNDGVPQTISAAKGYRHHSTEYWELDPVSAANTRQCNGQEPPDCNNSQPGIGIGTDGRGINPAHLCYTGISIGNPLDAGASSCSTVSIFPQKCSGGIVRRRRVVYS